MLQAIIEQSSNNHQAIIQLQMQIPEFCSKQLLVFLFDIHNYIFPHIAKKKFWKKMINVNVKSNHPAIIKTSQNHHQTTNENFQNFAQNQFFLTDSYNNMFHHIAKKVFFKKNINVSSNYQTIIKWPSNYKSKFPNFFLQNIYIYHHLKQCICFNCI